MPKKGLKCIFDTDSWEQDQMAIVYVEDTLVGKAVKERKTALNRAAKRCPSQN